MRSHAKAVNFGIIYGMQAFKLSKDTGVSIAFAKQYIENYFTFYKQVQIFINETVKQAEKNGFVETMLGRRRYIPELKMSNKNKRKQGERIAVNTLIQGSAADIIKRGTVAIYKSFLEQNLRSRILLQVHDELIIEAPLEEVETVSTLVIALLSQAAPSLKTALTVHHSIATRWDALK
jgi:DNA polymerase-1